MSPGVPRWLVSRRRLLGRGLNWRLLTRRSLRGRLIAGLVALLAIACATVGVTAYVTVRNAVSGSLNDQLQSASSRWANCKKPPATSSTGTDSSTQDSDSAGPDAQDAADSQVCPGLGPRTFDARLADGTVTSAGVINPHGNSPYTLLHLSAADTRTLLSLPAQQTGGLPGSTTLRVYTRTLTTLNGTYRLTAERSQQDGDILVTGLPTADMDSTLGTVEITEILVFAVAVLLTGVLGTIWVRLSLRPLERVATTAAQVADLPLETGEVELPAGVPDTDPGTEAGRVGASFNRMLGHVQAALARRAASEARLRRFAADASHELRTPLSSIRGYTELALRHPGEVPEEVTHALRRVEAESARMSVLVDDLLLLARLDAGRPLGSEPVDLSRLAIDATSDARVARPDHRWMLDLPDDPVQVLGDELRLHQVLANLLSNAGRHTPAASTVTVRLTLNPAEPAVKGAGEVGGDDQTSYVRRGDLPQAPLAELSVTDDGPGIPPELLPELFERFTRADTARTHADGSSTGLGLAIVDAVVAAHKGCITVTSRPGMTRFSITLTGLPADGFDTSPTPPRQRGSRRILHLGGTPAGDR
jgi:two-component system OmpR family sensor kinase